MVGRIWIPFRREFVQLCHRPTKSLANQRRQLRQRYNSGYGLFYMGYAGSGYGGQSGSTATYGGVTLSTVAWADTHSSWNNLAAGAFRDLSVQWTCPAQDNGLPLDVMTIFHCGSSQVCMDNVRLVDTTASSTAPAAPSGLTATAVSGSQINLSWTDNSNNETGFQIQQATNSTFTTGVTTATVGANVTNYSATGLSLGTTYYYQVLAYNTVGNSAYSSPAMPPRRQPFRPLPAA